jgi:hypothetical protein
MELAGDQFRPGVADADDRPTIEDIVRQTRPFHPAAVDEAIPVELAKALLTAQGLLGHLFSPLADAGS